MNQNTKLRVIVACPLKPGMDSRLMATLLANMQLGVRYCLQVGVDVFPYYEQWVPQWKPEIRDHPARARYVAAVRNHTIHRLASGLTSPTHVIWLDADVVRFAPDLFYKLVMTSMEHNAVTAPMVFLDHTNGKVSPGRWYDTAGFIHGGMRADLWYPWFAGERSDRPLPELLEVDGSVGCVYCVPWDVYVEGASHHYVDDQKTEHYPVCQHARAMGKKLLVMTTESVHHAYLPDYGEEFH